MATSKLSKLFELIVTLFQNPILARPGAKVQGEFKLMPINAIAIIKKPNGDVFLVLDVSGSMSGEGIATLIPAVTSGISFLEDGQTVGIITFNDSFQWLIRPTVLNPKTRNQILQQVRSLSAGGMTRFTEPVTDAVKNLLTGSAEIHSLILMTDGASTVDQIRDNQNVENLFTNKVAPAGIMVEIFGMGSDYQEVVVASWAKAAGGNYYHILSSGANLQSTMQQSMLRAAKAVAGNVEIEFRTVPGVTIAELYRTAPQRTKIDVLMNGTLAVDKIGAVNDVEGAPYQAVFLFADMPPVQDGVKLAEVTISYDLGGKRNEETYYIVADFTTDRSKVQENFSVAQTMQKTRITVAADQAYQNLSVAKTMNDTAAMQNASRALTMAQTMAGNLGDDDLASLISGMSSDDPDEARANRTRLVSGGDLEDLLKGLGSDDNK